MKKISVALVILMIFNFIYHFFIPINVYANDEPNDLPSSEYMEEYKMASDKGTATIGGQERKIELKDSDVGSSASKVATVFVNIASGFAKIFSKITYDGGLYYTESEFSAEKNGIFTINSLVFGEYLIFNSKAYQKSTDLNSSIAPSNITKSVDLIKERASSLSQFFVKLGLALALPMALYAIMKTVNAKKASDLAAWKKILVRWALCIFLILFYNYIFAVIDTAVDYLMDTLWNIRIGLEDLNYKAFEVTVEEEISKQFINSGGVISMAYAIIFVGIIYMQILFLVKYSIRVFGIILLFVIAPLVIIIHSVKLMLGKESSILGDLFKDYTLLVFMQPLHAILYLIFFFSLSEIAINVPILGILLLYALLRANNIAKAMFGWELGTSLFSRR